MRSRHLLACFCGALASGGVLLFACNSSNDSLPPIYTHVGGNDGGGQGATGDDSGVVVRLADGAIGDSCVETTSASPSGTTTSGPASLPFDPCGNGSPDALYWDDGKQVLYIADDRGNQLWTWSDAAGFQKLAKLPDDAAADDAGGTKLTGITLAGSTLYIARYGNGAFGALFQYDLTTNLGTATSYGTVDPTRYRFSVAYDSTGQKVYSDSFGGDAGGTIDFVGPTATTTFASGLIEPRGMLVSGTNIVVSDWGANAIYAVPLTPAPIVEAGADAEADGGDAGDAGESPYPVLASIPGPYQLSAGPGGSIFAGQRPADGGAPLVQQIFADGGVASLPDAGAFTQPSGIAYDSAHNRVFVADSDGAQVRTIKIYPVSP